MRCRMKEAVIDLPDGPIPRAALEAVGFTEEASRAAGFEWQRKTDKGPWQERHDNATLAAMTKLWTAVGRLMRRNGPALSGGLTLGRNRDGARVIKVAGVSPVHKAWNLPTALYDGYDEREDLSRIWPQVELRPFMHVAAAHETVIAVESRA